MSLSDIREASIKAHITHSQSLRYYRYNIYFQTEICAYTLDFHFPMSVFCPKVLGTYLWYVCAVSDILICIRDQSEIKTGGGPGEIKSIFQKISGPPPSALSKTFGAPPWCCPKILEPPPPYISMHSIKIIRHVHPGRITTGM